MNTTKEIERDHLKEKFESIDTAEEFVHQIRVVTDKRPLTLGEKDELNAAWAKVKARLPNDKKVEGETTVRAILEA